MTCQNRHTNHSAQMVYLAKQPGDRREIGELGFFNCQVDQRHRMRRKKYTQLNLVSSHTASPTRSEDCGLDTARVSNLHRAPISQKPWLSSLRVRLTGIMRVVLLVSLKLCQLPQTGKAVGRFQTPRSCRGGSRRLSLNPE